jgi:hypothetical protein
MKNSLAALIALVCAVALFIPIAKWEYARAVRKHGWHIKNQCATTIIQDFWTTNPTYVTVVWETNGVTITSRVVTNQFK